MRADDDAARVIGEAHRLAARLGHATSDVPHLLWAIVTRGSGDAQRVLRALGHDPDELIRAVEAELPPPDPDFGGWRACDAGEEMVRVTAAFKAVIDGATGNGAQGAGSIVDEAALLDAVLTTKDAETLALLKRVGLEPQESPVARTAWQSAHHAGLVDSSLLELVGQYGRILTEEARAGRLDPVVGRAAELRRLGDILGRRRKNNPVLLGEPGVGKTAIVEGLAQAIVDGEVPSAIAGKHIFALNVGSLVAGTRYRGEFEERVQLLLEWLADSRESVILFIDELHLLAGAGGAEGAIDAASFFKPQLARGELRAIGATTAEEYRRHIVADGALERRFQPVFVSEPTPRETLEMLRGLRGTYESFHGVSISDAALAAAVRMSLRRLPERRLPDKAIDLIDEAASRTRARAEVDGGAPSSGVGTGPSDVAGGRRALATEVTPEDVSGVIDAWDPAGATRALKKDVYSLSGLPARQRLAAIRRRFRR